MAGSPAQVDEGLQRHRRRRDEDRALVLRAGVLVLDDAQGMRRPVEAQLHRRMARVQPQRIAPRRVEEEDAVAAGEHLASAHDHGARQHLERIHAPHELGDVIVRGAQHDVLRSARLHDAAVSHDRDPVAEPERLVEVMAHEQDRLLDARLHREQLVLQLVADQRVERRERLVHQQDVRIGREGAREPDALLHAAREFADVAVRPGREADQLELARDVLAAAPRRLARGTRARSRRSRPPSARAAARTAGTPSRCARAAVAAGPRRCSGRRRSARSRR